MTQGTNNGSSPPAKAALRSIPGGAGGGAGATPPTSPPPPSGPTSPPPQQGPPQRVDVLVGANLADETRRSIAALVAGGRVYQRAQRLMIPVVTERMATKRRGVIVDEGTVQLAEITQAKLAVELSDAVDYRKSTANGNIPIRPPPDVVSSVHSFLEWDGIPHLDAATDVPLLRQDGSLIVVPGYDPVSRVYYRPRMVLPPIPEAPTRAQAVASAAVLLDCVSDFPFVSEPHRSAWLASLLTPFARRYIPGTVPLFAYDKNAPGAGGSLMADVTGNILLGADMSKYTHTEDEEEQRKRITSELLKGSLVMGVDNVTRKFGSPVYDAALTLRRWSDRTLGKNQSIDVENNLVFYITGNNITPKRDTSRRIIRSRIEVDVQNPEQRTDFRYQDIRAHIRANRPALVAAALTILRSYIAAGEPNMGVARFGSFEDWADIVAGACVWAGQADPVLTQREIQAVGSEDANEDLELLEAWEEYQGDAWKPIPAVVQELNAQLATARSVTATPKNERLRFALAAASKQNPSQPLDPGKIGYVLRQLNTRPIGHLMLLHGEKRLAMGYEWRVLPIEQARPILAKRRAKKADGAE